MNAENIQFFEPKDSPRYPVELKSIVCLAACQQFIAVFIF